MSGLVVAFAGADASECLQRLPSAHRQEHHPLPTAAEQRGKIILGSDSNRGGMTVAEEMTALIAAGADSLGAGDRLAARDAFEKVLAPGETQRS